MCVRESQHPRPAARQPPGALLVGQHQCATRQRHGLGHLGRGPLGVEQRGAAPRHHHRHESHDKGGRVASGNPHPIAPRHAMARHQHPRQPPRRVIGLGESQPQCAIHQKLRPGVFGAKMREAGGQALGRVLENGQRAAKTLRRGGLEGRTRRGQRRHHRLTFAKQRRSLCRHLTYLFAL